MLILRMYFRTAFIIVSFWEKKYMLFDDFLILKMDSTIGFMKSQVKDFDYFHLRVYDRFFIIDTVNNTVSSTRIGCYTQAI